MTRIVVSIVALEEWKRDQKKLKSLIDGIFRVVKPGGRIAISDIVSDEPVPPHLEEDTELWSRCISVQEQDMINVFLKAGFQAVSFDKWSIQPWRVVEEMEFRSVTLTATKPLGKECLDMGYAVIYKGPFSFIKGDDGHAFPRGERIAVCERTFRFMTEGPYNNDFTGIKPAKAKNPVPWCTPAGTRRPSSETKGGEHIQVNAESSCC